MKKSLQSLWKVNVRKVQQPMRSPSLVREPGPSWIWRHHGSDFMKKVRKGTPTGGLYGTWACPNMWYSPKWSCEWKNMIIIHISFGGTLCLIRSPIEAHVLPFSSTKSVISHEFSWLKSRCSQDFPWLFHRPHLGATSTMMLAPCSRSLGSRRFLCTSLGLSGGLRKHSWYGPPSHLSEICQEIQAFWAYKSLR